MRRFALVAALVMLAVSTTTLSASASGFTNAEAAAVAGLPEVPWGSYAGIGSGYYSLAFTSPPGGSLVYAEPDFCEGPPRESHASHLVDGQEGGLLGLAAGKWSVLCDAGFASSEVENQQLEYGLGAGASAIGAASSAEAATDYARATSSVASATILEGGYVAVEDVTASLTRRPGQDLAACSVGRIVVLSLVFENVPCNPSSDISLGLVTVHIGRVETVGQTIRLNAVEITVAGQSAVVLGQVSATI